MSMQTIHRPKVCQTLGPFCYNFPRNLLHIPGYTSQKGTEIDRNAFSLHFAVSVLLTRFVIGFVIQLNISNILVPILRAVDRQTDAIN